MKEREKIWNEVESNIEWKINKYGMKEKRTLNERETQTQHVVESTGVFNNHQTCFLIFFPSKHGQTDSQTGAPVEVPPVLKNTYLINY